MKRLLRNKTIKKNEKFNILQAAIVTERINTIIKLSLQKAVLHSQNPSIYPLPQKKSALENLFYNQLKNLSKDKKDSVINKIKCISPYRIKQTSGFTKVNLRKSDEIAKQVKGIVSPKTISISNTLYKTYEENTGFHLERPKTETKYKKLQCRIKKVECIETNDYRKDEIKLAGVAVNSLLEPEEIGKILIGKKIKKGDVINFSPAKTFYTFDLTESDEWPKKYFLTFILAEIDLLGGFTTFLKELMDEFGDLVASEIAEYLEELSKPKDNNEEDNNKKDKENTEESEDDESDKEDKDDKNELLNDILEAVIKYLFEEGINKLKSDIFTPVNDFVIIDSNTYKFFGDKDTLTNVQYFSEENCKGEYKIEYEWKLLKD